MDKQGFDKSFFITNSLKKVDWWFSAKAHRFTGNFSEVEAFISNPENLKSWNKK
jgi:hypothetical protein